MAGVKRVAKVTMEGCVDLCRCQNQGLSQILSFNCQTMPTYVYETQPVDTAVPPRRFEVKQSMKDAPLTHDPETGLPVRRVIGANINFLAADNTGSGAGPAGGSCGTGCGCH